MPRGEGPAPSQTGKSGCACLRERALRFPDPRAMTGTVAGAERPTRIGPFDPP